MVELCLMASHGYPPGNGLVFHQEQPISRVSKDSQHSLSFPFSNEDSFKAHSFSLSLHQSEEWKSSSPLLDNNNFVKFDSTTKRHELFDDQDSHPNSVFFSFGIAEQCMRREKILRLLSSGSSEQEGCSLDLSMLFDLLVSQPPITDSPQQAFFFELQQSLMYPTKEFYIEKSPEDLVRDLSDISGISFHPDGQLSFNGSAVEMKDVLSVIAEFYLSKNSIKSSKPTMLVPYFERRRRRANTNGSSLGALQVAPLESPEKVKDKTSAKKKMTRKATKERDLYSNTYIHACETLLSIMADRKQPAKSAINSLKKSTPELPHLLTQFSATIAGTGIAVLFSVVCTVARGMVPFCASKVLTTGIGLGLIWLSWAVNNLRGTIINISRNSGRLDMKEEDMMSKLNRSLKDIYFRAAALMAVVVLRLA